VKRKTRRHIDAPGRIEYVAVRVIPAGEAQARNSSCAAHYAGLLRASEINETFAKIDSNSAYPLRRRTSP